MKPSWRREVGHKADGDIRASTFPRVVAINILQLTVTGEWVIFGGGTAGCPQDWGYPVSDMPLNSIGRCQFPSFAVFPARHSGRGPRPSLGVFKYYSLVFVYTRCSLTGSHPLGRFLLPTKSKAGLPQYMTMEPGLGPSSADIVLPSPGRRGCWAKPFP